MNDPLNADKQQIAAMILEQLAAHGIARKVHRDGCTLWPKYSLCDCPWEVIS